MNVYHHIRLTVLFLSFVLAIEIKNVNCILPRLTNIAGSALSNIGRLTEEVGDSLSDAFDRNRDNARYRSNEGGFLGELREKHRDRHNKRIEKLCEFFRRGRLYKGPCKGDEGEKERDRIVGPPPTKPHPKPPTKPVSPRTNPPPNKGKYKSNKCAWIRKKQALVGEYRITIDKNLGYRQKCRNKVNRKQKGRKHKNGSKNRKKGGHDGIHTAPCQTKEGLEGFCQTMAYCFSQFNDVDEFSDNTCTLKSGHLGICCPQKVRPPQESFLPIRIPHPIRPSAKIRHISLEDINTAAEEAQQFIKVFIQNEQKLISSGFFQRRGSSQAQHQAFFGKFDRHQFKLTKGGFINLITTIKIKNKFKLTKEQARDGLQKYSIENTDLEQFCLKEPVCKQSKYRTADGSCNNLQKPLWGRSNTAFTRLVPPQYADGLDKPRISVNGDPLPGARVVSVAAAMEHDLNDKKFTLFVMQWGQFIDHDLTLSASTRAASGEGLICCQDGLKENTRHPSCLPIHIPENDPFYAQHRQTCMNFVRNAPSPRPGCTLGHREQMNTLTHYIDGSMVYGSTNDLMNHLRSFKEGKLRHELVNNVEFLPFDSENRSDECGVPERERLTHRCFVGGDVRVNEQTGLTMLHNLLLREHNRVASELLRLNPKWHDETVYQEARRIVAAEIQHIEKNEWTPLILGRTVMKEFNILPKTYGFSNDYDPSVNPSIINSFATAAYRFHTLIQGVFLLMNNAGDITRRLQLRNLFNNPSTIYPNGAFDEYLNGFTAEPTQTFDKHFTKELTNHLFQEHGHSFGMDLISLNLQRGREHGLPGYNEYRKVCGLEPINSFKELDAVMQKGSAQTFAKLYSTVDDIDLFIAGNHERALPDAVVGPTFACILAEQSRRGKLGDRFWYENGELPHSFSEAQLHEIRKSSLARLICDNSDNIKHMQPLAFLQPIGWNKRIDCKKIGSVNLHHWKGERIWTAN